MNAPAPAADAIVDDASVIAATRRWLTRAVIGLNLCPFAKAVHAKGQVRIVVSAAATPGALLADLAGELALLQTSDPRELDTTLLVHPRVLGDFHDYNAFLDEADAAVDALGLTGEIQVASFHPDYVFADADMDDAANCTNRSPFPLLHLLREESVARAVEAYPDPDVIVERNIERLDALGIDGYRALLEAPEPPPHVAPELPD